MRSSVEFISLVVRLGKDTERTIVPGDGEGEREEVGGPEREVEGVTGEGETVGVTEGVVEMLRVPVRVEEMDGVSETEFERLK